MSPAVREGAVNAVPVAEDTCCMNIIWFVGRNTLFRAIKGYSLVQLKVIHCDDEREGN